MLKPVGLTFLVLILGGIGATAQRYFSTFAWSPDSKQILFGEENYADGRSDFQLSVMNADGTEKRKLVGDAWSPTWSPDGKKIAYSLHTAAGDNLWLANADGKNPVQLTNNGGTNFEPAFFPNGRHISYTQKTNGTYTIYQISINGEDQGKLIGDDISVLTGTWSADGRKLLYYKDKGDRMDKICVYDVKSKKETIITGDTLHSFYPSWTKNGLILFSSTFRFDQRDESIKLYTINITGKNKKQVGNSPVWFARMSPDGKKIAFTSDGAQAMYVCEADGSNPKLIARTK